MTDPRHPVIVGASEVAVRTADAEPVSMMVQASLEALAETGDRLRPGVNSVRVVKGIWPYADPGRIVAEQLGLDNVSTATTRIGGNATYDLINQTAAQIVNDELDVAIVCGAETMRTRRKDKAAGRRSPYLDEAEGTQPDLVVGEDVDLVDASDLAAGVGQPVNFYAMVESAIRHRNGESIESHLRRISELWERGSNVAAQNPHAWIPEQVSAEQIATTSPTNRMIAAPYTKLLTSNINVDQGAAVVVASYGVASSAGVPDDQMVFLVSGSGASDRATIRERNELDRSPAFRSAATRALEFADLQIEDIEHIDLYSCFPSSVQLAQRELGLSSDRPFTLTGGLTFAGGPFNGYCTQAIAHAASVLRGTTDRAFLYGNGGYFSKHSVLVASGIAPRRQYRYQRTQEVVDAAPSRPVASSVSSGVIEAYTVVFDRDNAPERAIVSILDTDGSRHWGVDDLDSDIATMLEVDMVGASVELSDGLDESVRAVRLVL